MNIDKRTAVEMVVWASPFMVLLNLASLGALAYILISTIKRGTFFTEGVVLLICLFVARAILRIPIRWHAQRRLERQGNDAPSE